MLKEIIISIQSFFDAHRFINKHKLWRWILLPGLFYCIIFMAGMWLFGKTSIQATEMVLKQTGLRAWVESMQESWLNWLVIVAQFFIIVILFFFYFSLFKFVFLVIGSPVFAYLSEKTESILEDKEFPFSFPQFFKDIVRGIRIATRNLLWQSVYVLTILILSFIPIVGWIGPLVALLVECYYLGFSMLDYSSERNKLSTSQSITLIGNHKGLAIGNGLVFYMMHFIPFLGWLLAPSYAVIAATLSLHKARAKQVIM
jgi:CysZ protein